MGLLLRFLLKTAYRHFTMVYEKFIEVGAVVYITLGHHKGKIAAIANVIDANRLLVDGPCSDVPRCVVNLKQVQLTKFKIKIPFGYRTGGIKKVWEKEGVTAQWAETKWAKRIEAKSRKAALSDFDRFKLMKLKQKRAKIINSEIKRLKKEAK